MSTIAGTTASTSAPAAAAAASSTSLLSSISSSTPMEKSYQDLEAWLAKLLQGMPLAETEVKTLCDLARETFLQESNVQPVSAPVTVCGDIHGKKAF